MKVSLLAVILPCVDFAGAFAPKSPLSDVKRSFEALTKPLKSSRAEPIVEQKVESSVLSPTLPKRIATTYKRWGIDNSAPDEYFEENYWADSRIHTLGNLGILGAVSYRLFSC